MRDVRKVAWYLWVLVGVLLLGSGGAVAMAGPTAVQGEGQSRPVVAGEVPQGLSAEGWAAIQGQIVAGSYRAYASETGGYQSANPAQGWKIAFGADGRTRLTPREVDSPWEASLKLVGYGFAELRAVDAPQGMHAVGERLSYQWDSTVEEWWINRPTGLEQGFTLGARPADARAGEPLRVALAVGGDLVPVQQGDTVAWQDASGATRLTYSKLRVWDAAGTPLPARMALAGDRLTLVVDEANARYPLTIDPLLQQAYLKASNTAANDHFGWAVAVAGDTVVVGAWGEDSNAVGVNGNQTNNNATDSGAAYVFVRSGTSWTQQAYLKASNTGAGDNFGYAVALSADTVLVGALLESSNATGVNGDQSNDAASWAGAAYVFVRSGTSWSQQAYLKASNTGTEDQFGYSVALAGDTVVVGARYESSNATGVNGNQTNNNAAYSGAAYVFVRSGTAWTQQAYLKASNTEANDEFGISVAVSGDTVAVGTPLEDSNATGVNGDEANNSASGAGAAYLFARSGTNWTQQAYLKASNTEASDNFGFSLSVSGNTVVVGAWREDSDATGVDGDQTNNNAGGAGAAYVFVRNGTSWSQQAYLKASNTGASDRFGYSVALTGDTVMVGAPYESSNATGVNGDQSNNAASWAGAAYMFVRSSTSWTQHLYLKASNTDALDQFGTSMSKSGDTFAVGTDWERSNATGVNGDQSNNAAIWAGAAYVFMAEPLAVTLQSFEAEGSADSVALSWETVSELDNLGFHLLRSDSEAFEETVRITTALIPSAASGGSSGAYYEWTDSNVVVGARYYYWLEPVDVSGQSTFHGPVSATAGVPTAVTLGTLFSAQSSPRALSLAVLGLAMIGLGWAARRHRA